MELPASLQKKLGPLPVWGWGAIGAGVVFFFYLRKKKTATATGTGSPVYGQGSYLGSGGGAGGGLGGDILGGAGSGQVQNAGNNPTGAGSTLPIPLSSPVGPAVTAQSTDLQSLLGPGNYSLPVGTPNINSPGDPAGSAQYHPIGPLWAVTEPASTGNLSLVNWSDPATAQYQRQLQLAVQQAVNTGQFNPLSGQGFSVGASGAPTFGNMASAVGPR